jgi:DNA mismatch endonuclease (patch repair protein)
VSRTRWGTVRADCGTTARMRRVGRRDTPCELQTRSALHAMGLRFRTRNADLPGSPDVANRRKRWAVFVHGCFWHQHPGCARATIPRRNAGHWSQKFTRNVERDLQCQRLLRSRGYHVLVVWECETRDQVTLVRRLRAFFG